jgi:hypothetical protein
MKRWILVIIVLVVILLFIIYFVTTYILKKPFYSREIIVKTEIPAQKYIDSGQPLVFSGVIKEINNNTLKIDSYWYDPIEKTYQVIPVNVTLNPQDKILRYYTDNKGKIQTKELSLSDLKIGDFIFYSAKENKKTIRVVPLLLSQKK